MPTSSSRPLLVVAFLVGVAASLPAQAPRAALPDEVLVVVEVTDPGAAWSAVLQAVGPVPPDLPESVRALLGVGLTTVRLWLGASPAERIEQWARGGVALGYAPAEHGFEPLLAMRPGDPAAAVAFVERIGGKARIEGEWVLAGKSLAACERLRRRLVDGPARWAAWPVAEASPAAVRVLADLQRLRALPTSRPLLPGLDGGGRFLFGPLAVAIDASERAQLELVGGDALQLRARLFAGHGGDHWSRLSPTGGQARSMLAPPTGALGMVALDRSLHALFADLQAFLRESDVLAAQGFLSIADQIDGAATSFVDDLLRGLKQPWTLYLLPAAAIDAEQEPTAPRLRLPGFALVAPIDDPEVETILRRMAQLFVVIANAERAQAGKKPFVLRPERGEHGSGFVAEPTPWRGPGQPPVEYGLSPTLLFGHGHVVLGSTRAAATALLAQAAAGATATLVGDRVTLHGPTLAAAALQNRGPLVVARMLDEGETRSVAERFWDTFVAVAAAISVELTSQVAADAAEITVTVRRQS